MCVPVYGYFDLCQYGPEQLYADKFVCKLDHCIWWLELFKGVLRLISILCKCSFAVSPLKFLIIFCPSVFSFSCGSETHLNFIPYLLCTDFSPGFVTNGMSDPRVSLYFFLGLSHHRRNLALNQGFSTFRVHQNPLKFQVPAPRISDAVGLGWGLRFCISDKFPGRY